MISLSVAFHGLQVVRSEAMPPKEAFRHSPDLMYVGPVAYRAIQWEVEGRKAWAGRDWRRIKRERRKYMAEAKPRESK